MFATSKNHKIQILSDTEVLSKVAAETLFEHMRETLMTRDVFSIALSGGSTPRRLFALLAGDAVFRDQISWDRVHFFWGDERHVSPDHPDSNYRMANNTLLSKVPIPSTNIHRIRAEDSDAGKAAGEYEQEIRQFFKIDGRQIPRFDCALMGMGADGHTASLFPGTPALEETRRLVVANWVEKFQSYRITMTVPVFNNSRRVIFLVSGQKKANILASILAPRQESGSYPVQLIRPDQGRLIWLIDAAAGSHLELDH